MLIIYIRGTEVNDPHDFLQGISPDYPKLPDCDKEKQFCSLVTSKLLSYFQPSKYIFQCAY